MAKKMSPEAQAAMEAQAAENAAKAEQTAQLFDLVFEADRQLAAYDAGAAKLKKNLEASIKAAMDDAGGGPFDYKGRIFGLGKKGERYFLKNPRQPKVTQIRP